MKLRKIEIIALGLAIIEFIFLRFEITGSYAFAFLLSIILLFMFAIGGYRLFKTNDEVKFGKQFSIISGILLGFIYCLLFIDLILDLIPKLFAYSVLSALFLVLGIVFIVLIKKNKGNDQTKKHIWFAGSRIVFPFVLFLMIAFIPYKSKIILIHGTESRKYYETMQYEFYQKSYSESEAGNSEEAVKSSLLAIEYSKKRGDKLDELFQRSLNSLGYAYYINSEYQKADSIFNKVLELSNSPFFGKTECYAQAQYYLGLNFSKRGYYKKSDSLLLICLNNEQLQLIKSYIYKTLGYNFNHKGYYQKADSLYNLSLQIFEKSANKDFKSYINTLRDKASNDVDMSKFGIADSIYQSVLKLSISEYGISSLEVADVYDDLSSLNYVLSNYDKAKNFTTKSLSINARLFGKEDYHYLYPLLQFTSIKMAMSDYDNAETTLLNIKSIIDDKYDINSHLATLTYDLLFELYRDFSNFDKAELYADKSLNARTYAEGKYSLKTAKSLDNRAYVYYCKNDFILSDSLYTKACLIKQIYQDQDNLNYITSLNGLALVYSATNRLDTAGIYFEHSRKTIENRVGKQHPEYAIIISNIGYLRLKQKEFVKAEQCFNEALLINKKLFGTIHLNIAENLLGLASLNEIKGENTTAKNNYTEALTIYKKLFKFKHPKCIMIESKLNVLK
jgi:hypothetical protein